MTNHFEKYVNLIRKSAHYYSNMFNIEYEEVEAQGFLIYCQCVDNYDITKSTFSNHLTIELKRLKDYCESLCKHEWHSAYSMNDDECKSDFEYNELPSMDKILEVASYSLSNMAYKVLEWILNRSWEKKGRAKPTITNACDEFQVSNIIMKNIWEEIGNFYKTALVF